MLAAYRMAVEHLQDAGSSDPFARDVLFPHKEWRRLLERIDRRPAAQESEAVRAFFATLAETLYPAAKGSAENAEPVLQTMRAAGDDLRAHAPDGLLPTLSIDMLPPESAWKLQWELAQAQDTMVALEHASVLQGFREDPHAVAWEIGAGFGLFACLFKTVFPRARYLISDTAPQLLAIETLIRSTFPDAAVVYRPASPAGEPPEGGTASAADFVLVPLPALPAEADGPLEAVVGSNGLAELPCETVDRLVSAAHSQGARYFHVATSSMRSPRSLCDEVLAVVGRHYWPRVIPTQNQVGQKAAEEGGCILYTHTIGWRRLATS